jgi:hypothetical protein
MQARSEPCASGGFCAAKQAPKSDRQANLKSKQKIPKNDKITNDNDNGRKSLG